MRNPTPDYVAQLGRVTPRTRALALEVLAAAAGAGHVLDQVWGYNPASKPEHSSGRAVDFMCSRAAGDWIAAYLWAHRHRLGLRWMIWRQRIRSTTPGKTSSWQPMADRGNTTANHLDHIHAFFDDTYQTHYADAPLPPTDAATPGTSTPTQKEEEEDMAIIESISDEAADKLGAAVAKYLVAQAKSEHLIVHAALESVSDKAAGKIKAAVNP